MTAKKTRKEFHDLIWNGTEGTPEHINRLEALLEQFALQVATDAVEEERKKLATIDDMSHGILNGVFKNIKKRLDENS
ncbi:hypothetical protein [Gracilimonas sp.]|uniref:hypothetical protein n=1 Tax=Gracilimonas sp. TaxID=1974203 RepID=UPI0028718A3F|nr:hypothetical protein [Gracilimonas sp.]